MKSCDDCGVLRAALVGLVGVDTRPELEQMEAAMRLLPAPATDKAATIDAIHALLKTLPPSRLEPTWDTDPDDATHEAAK